MIVWALFDVTCGGHDFEGVALTKEDAERWIENEKKRWPQLEKSAEPYETVGAIGDNNETI